MQLTLTIGRIEFHDTYQVDGTLGDGSKLFVEAKRQQEREALVAILPEFLGDELQQKANQAFLDANPPDPEDPDRAYMLNEGKASVTLDMPDIHVPALLELQRTMGSKPPASSGERKATVTTTVIEGDEHHVGYQRHTATYPDGSFDTFEEYEDIAGMPFYIG